MNTREQNELDERVIGLRIRSLRKAFGHTTVLDDIDLDVMHGELISVLGPSGSGKTTLLRLLCGFERADGGRIELDGKRVAQAPRIHIPPEKRGIGYVAQEGALFPHLDVTDNILFGLQRKVRKASKTARQQRVERLLELVDLPGDYARRTPAMLSGGEQQRVALARALAPEPAIVLLDEPFSALDTGLRDGLRHTIARSLKRVGATALLVTHDQDEALSIADRTAVLQNGKIAQIAPPVTLYKYPANPALARFVGDAVFTSGEATEDQVECCFGRLRVAPETRVGKGPATGWVTAMIRPEQFRLHAAQVKTPLTARVEEVTFYGRDAKLALRLDCGEQFVACVPSLALPQRHDTVGVTIVGDVVVYQQQAAN